jgi:uncharacterized protein YjbI with pentapeptide repeats
MKEYYIDSKELNHFAYVSKEYTGLEALTTVSEQGLNYLANAELDNKDFVRANLESSRIYYKDFVLTNFGESNLSNSEFVGCSTMGLNFAEANLSGCTLSFTNFICANFNGADLRDISISNCNFDECNFDGVAFNSKILCEYFNRLGYFLTIVLDKSGRIYFLTSKENPIKDSGNKHSNNTQSSRLHKLTKFLVQTNEHSLVINPNLL